MKQTSKKLFKSDTVRTQLAIKYFNANISVENNDKKLSNEFIPITKKFLKILTSDMRFKFFSTKNGFRLFNTKKES